MMVKLTIERLEERIAPDNTWASLTGFHNGISLGGLS